VKKRRRRRRRRRREGCITLPTCTSSMFVILWNEDLHCTKIV
jgi:hypothetical protein